MKHAEIVGTWLGWDGTEVALEADGTAIVTRLDGQEYDFDEGWRMSGTGIWQQTDARVGWGEGQHVIVTVTRQTSWEERRDPKPGHEILPGDRESAPGTYKWTLEMERGAKGLRLFFLFRDPDSRSYYYLERKSSGTVK
ncbi:hypothetical protein [Streptomyces sp. NPDC052042]|uniref:hypothetical protein n=1 Tax=Streptomyces sp. NPDC052042 TaxID=3365683 RepID=UPI0037D2354C